MTAPIHRRMTAMEWAILLMLASVWGGSFLFITLALHSFPPLTLVWLRCTLASLGLFALLRISGTRLPRDRAAWLAFVRLGVLNVALPFGLVAWSQLHIATGLASILNATTPLWGVIVCHLFTRDEKATRGKVIGVVLGMAGVAAMIGGDAFVGLDSNLPAQIACVAAALSYAFAGLFSRGFAERGIAPIQVAAGQLIAAAALLLPIALIADAPWRLPLPHAESLAALAALGLVSTALAYILFFRLVETAGATNALLVTFLVPISAILLGMVFLGESLAPRHLTGMALIALGLAAIDGRLFSLWRAGPAERPS